MKMFNEQLIIFINKVKNNKSLQKKIVLLIGLGLLYHFFFGFLINWNVKIESITLKNAYRENGPIRDSIYSVSLENDKLKINKFSKITLEEKYCRAIDGHHKLRRVISFDPIIVECGSMKAVYYEVLITDGEKYRKVGYTSSTDSLYYSNYHPDRDKQGEYKYKDTVIEPPINSVLTVDAIEKKYCTEFDLKLREIIEFEPTKVVCGYPDSARTIYITNGEWLYLADKLDDKVVGQNEKYLLRENYSLIDKISGEIIIDNDINGMTNNNLHINGAATVSENMRFFIPHTSSTPQNPSLVEINNVGEKTVLYKFSNFDFFKTAHINALTSSSDGNYIFMLVEKSRRMPGDLFLYIVDVKNKSLIYRKTLAEYHHGYQNIYIRNHSGTIIFIFQASNNVHAYKVLLKN